MNTTTYAVDTAKNVMQLHWVDATGEIHRKKLARARFVEFFAPRQPSVVAMEACAGTHHWARTLGTLGHQVQLLPAQQVHAFVHGNKDDAADARAIWLAAQQRDVRRISVKSVEQQAVLALHRTRAHWIDVRTATINSLRGLLYEFGVWLPQGRRAALRTLALQRAQIEAALPALMQQLLNGQLQALQDIERCVQQLDAQVKQLQVSLPHAKRLSQVPGLGPLCSSALAAVLGDGRGWRNGRAFAASLGLCPSHRGSGGKVRIGSISRRGDPYLRTILISGARAVVSSAKAAQWIKDLLQRRPVNVVVVAVANKLARLAWALVAHQRHYERAWRSQAPSALRHAAS